MERPGGGERNDCSLRRVGDSIFNIPGNLPEAARGVRSPALTLGVRWHQSRFRSDQTTLRCSQVTSNVCAPASVARVTDMCRVLFQL